MFVYGIRCAPCDLSYLPGDAAGDYYMEYGLFVFPSYTKKTYLTSNGILTNSFWKSVKKIVEKPRRVHKVSFEDPYITDTENNILDALRESYSGISPGWYYCPIV